MLPRDPLVCSIQRLMGRFKLRETPDLLDLAEVLGGAYVRTNPVPHLLRSAGVRPGIHPAGDPGHDVATALTISRLVAKAPSMGRREFAISTPGMRTSPVPVELFWIEAREHREAGRLIDYAVCLARISGRLVRSGNPRRAESCLTVATKLARRLDSPWVSVHVVWARAELTFWNSHYLDAQRLFTLVLENMRAWRDPAGAAEVQLALGDCHWFLGEEEQAEACWREALMIHEDMGDAPAQAEGLERLAGLMLGRGELQGCLEQTERAADMWELGGLYAEADRCRARLDAMRRFADG